MLHNAFIKMGLNPLVLGDADKNRLSAEERAEWGSYYAQKPQIMAVRRIEGHSQHLFTEVGLPEPIAGVRCENCT